MADLIQFRRGLAASWVSTNPVLAEGELGLEIDTQKHKIGDGVTAWNSITAYSFSPTTTTVTMQETTTPAPVAGAVVTYAGRSGGRMLPKYVDPDGWVSAVQPFIAENKIGLWSPQGNATTLPGVWGYTAPTVVGTATVRNVATTNAFTRARRIGWVSAATAGSLSSFRVTVAQVTLGDGTTPGSGFQKVCRFGASDAAAVAGARMFVGVTASTVAPTNVEPSTLVNAFGVGNRAADTTLHIFYGGSAAQTPINLGADFPADTRNVDLYQLGLWCPIGGDLRWEVVRINTGHVATGTIAASAGVALPTPTTLLTPMMAWRSNNATAAAVGLDIVSDYYVTDT